MILAKDIEARIAQASWRNVKKVLVLEQSEQESAVQGSTWIMQNLIAVLRTLVFTVNEVGRHGGF